MGLSDWFTLKTNSEITFQQPHSLKNSFILSEYNRIYSEVRIINDKTVEFIKLYIAIATSAFLYSFGGLFYLSDLHKNPKFLFAYSLLGALLIFILLIITFYLFIELANSKKIKSRYWKLLDIIRGFIKNKYPEVWDALGLPPLENNNNRIIVRHRPNHSKNEVVGYLSIAFFLEMVWLVILVYFITNMIESWGNLDKIRLFKAMMIANSIFLIMVLYAPFQILKIRKMHKEAILIDKDNIYPIYPYGVHSKLAHNIFLFVGFILIAYYIYKFLFISSFYSNDFLFFFLISIMTLIDLYFILVGIIYYTQKKISADLIYNFRKENNNNPLAKWKLIKNIYINNKKI